jgi:hypothetical protein
MPQGPSDSPQVADPAFTPASQALDPGEWGRPGTTCPLRSMNKDKPPKWSGSLSGDTPVTLITHIFFIIHSPHPGCEGPLMTFLSL